MAKIQIADGKISSSADYSLYHGTTKVADIKQNAISGSSSSTGSFGRVYAAGNSTFTGTITGKTNASISSTTIGGDFSGAAFYTNGGDIVTGRAFFRGDSGGGDKLIGINNEGGSNDRLVVYNYSDSSYMMKLDYSGNATFTGTIGSGAITSTAGIIGTTGTFTGNILSSGANAKISGSSSSTGSFGAVHIGGATDYPFQMNPPSSAATEVISARLSTLYIAGADGHPELSSGASAGSLTLAAAGVGNNSPRIETYGHNHASKAAQIRFATLDTDRMTISSSGEVGIGTASPGRKLHIHGSTNSNSGGAHVYYTTAADAYPIMATYGYSHDNMTRSFDMYINDAGQWISSDAGSNFDIAKGGDKLLFRYNSGTAAGSVMSAFPTAIAINTSGNVGIGTNAPKVACHIGSGSVADPITGADCLIMGDNQALSGTPGNLCIQTNDVQAIDKGGMLGFAGQRANNQSGALVFAAIAGRKESGTDGEYGAYLQFATRENGTNLAERMRIISNGKVGIGTNGPSSILHLNGASAQLRIEEDTDNDFMYIDLVQGGRARINLSDSRDLTIQEDGGGVTFGGTADPGSHKIYVQGTTYLGGPVTGSNAYFSGKVGIGTAAPGETFHIKSTSDSVGISLESTSTSHIAVLDIKGAHNSYGTGLAKCVRFWEGASVKNSIGVPSTGTDADALCFYVGSPDTSADAKLHDGGDWYTNDGSVSSLSDKRGKKDIEDLTDGLDIVKQLKPVTYKHNGLTWGKDDGVTRYGFVADDVLTVASQYVHVEDGKVGDEDVDDLKSMSMMRMFPMLVKSIQELSEKVEELESKISGSS